MPRFGTVFRTIAFIALHPRLFLKDCGNLWRKDDTRLPGDDFSVVVA